MSKCYVDNKTMLAELINYSETGVVSNKLGEMFQNIATRYAFKMYAQYHFPYHLIEDIVGDIVYRMMEKVSKFDSTRQNANPFAYFTQIAHNQVLGSLKKERKHFDGINNLREEIWTEFSAEYNLENHHLNLNTEHE